MILEEGTKLLLLITIIGTLIIVGGFILILYMKRRNKGLLWFIPELLMLGFALYFFTRLIENPLSLPNTMLSEENTLMLGAMTLTWIMSMVFMMIGICKSINNERKVAEKV